MSFFGLLFFGAIGYSIDKRIIRKQKELGIYQSASERKKHIQDKQNEQIDDFLNKIRSLKSASVEKKSEIRKLFILISCCVVLMFLGTIFIGTMSYLNQKGTYRDFIGQTVNKTESFTMVMSHIVPKINNIPPQDGFKYYSWEKVRFGQFIYAVNWFLGIIEAIILFQTWLLLEKVNLVGSKQYSKRAEPLMLCSVICFVILQNEFFSGLEMVNTYYSLHILTIIAVCLCVFLFMSFVKLFENITFN